MPKKLWLARASAAAGTAAIAAALLTALPGPASAAATPNQILFGVAATSARNAWAVGVRTGPATSQTLIEHWNGKSWKQVPGPQPGGSQGRDELLSVTAISARDAWAVGDYATATITRPLVVHWNGRSWKRVAVPFPCAGAATGGFLESVAATSAADVWAAGNAGSCVSQRRVALIMHWNGRSWKRVRAASPGDIGGTELRGVAAISRRNAWAVGEYSVNGGGSARTLIEHWNGRSWRQVASPGLSSTVRASVLSGVAISSPGNAWAVGSIETPSPTREKVMVLHWNGRSWRQVRAPNPGGASGDELIGVAAIPRSLAFWAVGDYTDPGSHLDRTLIERWNGRSWTHVSSPSPGFPAHDLGLFSVAATGARNAWAVGSYAGSLTQSPLREHWNGKSWRIRP